jgi:hypothetical protein
MPSLLTFPRKRRSGTPPTRARCHLGDGPALSPATAQRLACAATVTWMLHDHNGSLLDVRRRHRTLPPALRRAVRERGSLITPVARTGFAFANARLTTA